MEAVIEKIINYQDPNEYLEVQNKKLYNNPNLSLKISDYESPIMRDGCKPKLVKKILRKITETVEEPETTVIKEFINIDTEISNIEDILNLISTYKNDK